ncbi:MAG TPA: hypothetical protein DF383_11700, partial [Deltaproteobacteria bacterium]|nr:hypothetical protein [Deltaproteobacteria bacterium]
KIGKEVVGAQLQAFQGKKVAIDADGDKAMLSRLQSIVKRIGAVSHLPDLPYEVHLAESKVVNAWCAPGGKVMVYSGLWDSKKGLVQKQNDNEIAAVLAHELAHATARHVTESLSQNMTIQLAGSVASSAISAAGATTASNIFNRVFATGYGIYAPTYSRKHEKEADRIGLFYMAKAGYDPRAAIEVWTRASQKRGDRSSVFASHPSSGERAKELQKYLPEALEIFRDPQKPYPSFAKSKVAKAPKRPRVPQEAAAAAPVPPAKDDLEATPPKTKPKTPAPSSDLHRLYH